MNAVAPYLTFNGNTREAMEFYKDCFGGQMFLQTFGDNPGAEQLPAEQKDKVMHASITNGDMVLMASDSMHGQPVAMGSNISLSVNGTSKEQLTDLFNKISSGGNITMPLQDTFWGAHFGMCADKFGISWMFNYDYEKKDK